MNVTLSAPTMTKTASIATAFTRKLYRMLDVEDPAVIGWDESGLSFSIRDEEQLDCHVLPRYFRGRVDVFRQHLNEHGFHSSATVVGLKQVESFSHVHFVRGEPSRLSLIVRVPTNKRRRSRLGKKRATPGGAHEVKRQEDDLTCAMPSFVEDDSFNLCDILCGTDPSMQTPSFTESDQTSRNEELHNSLANILAMHATNPVLSSKSMLNDQEGRPISLDQIDTPLFSFEMMASMVEWLDTTA